MASTTRNDPSSPRRVFIIGADGGVGRRLTAILTADGGTVTGLHHSADSASAVRDAGGKPVRVDIATATAADLSGPMSGHDAIVFCAGAGRGGPELMDAIDGRGPGKAAAAAAQAGVDRFVLVSVFMDAWRGDQSPGEGFEHYMAAKRVADVDLAATDLDWLIVRPGTLSDDPGTGTVTAGAAVAYQEIPRDDLAAFLAAALFSPTLTRTVVEVTGGGISIEAALAALEPRPRT